MKTTYLVYKLVNGVRQLVTATPEEWDTILKGNRGLPAEQRRYFISDRQHGDGQSPAMIWCQYMGSFYL